MRKMGFSNNLPESLLAKYTRIVFVIACYWVVSILLVFVNKYLLSGQDVTMDAPLFVTFFQCFVTVVLCVVLRYLTNMFPMMFTFPSVQIKREILQKIFPLSIVFILMIIFNNLCLKNVGVPFYYIVRSLSTVFNVILTYLYLQQKTSATAIFCCFIIISGFALGVDQEGISGSLSIVGVVYGVLASFFVSMYSIYVKKVLPVVEGSIWRLTYYNNLNAMFLFVPLIIVFGELPQISNFQKLDSFYFWVLMVIGGVCGFGLGYVTALQIKVTSPLTHTISGTAKACAQTVIAVMWFHETKSFLWWLSNIIVLIGSGAYTRVRQMEMAKTYQEKITQLQNDLESQSRPKP